MHVVSVRRYDEALARVESDLNELAAALDRGVADELFQTAALALGIRARTLFSGSLVLFRSEAPIAARALLRPAVEINLTLRFLVKDRDLHTVLWAAEGERQAARLLREAEADPNMLPRLGGRPAPAEVHEDKRDMVEDARARALAAGVKGVGERGRVLPGLRSLAYEHGDAPAREAYTLAFRGLSPAVHTTSRAFDDGKFVRGEGGRVRFVELADPEGWVRSHRAPSATTFASTLAIVSDALGLGVEEGADTARGVLLNLVLEDEG